MHLPFCVAPCVRGADGRCSQESPGYQGAKPGGVDCIIPGTGGGKEGGAAAGGDRANIEGKVLA